MDDHSFDEVVEHALIFSRIARVRRRLLFHGIGVGPTSKMSRAPQRHDHTDGQARRLHFVVSRSQPFVFVIRVLPLRYRDTGNGVKYLGPNVFQPLARRPNRETR